MNEQDRLILLAVVYVVGFVSTLILSYRRANKDISEGNIVKGFESAEYAICWLMSILWPLALVFLALALSSWGAHRLLVKVTGG